MLFVYFTSHHAYHKYHRPPYKQALCRLSSPLLRHKNWTACCSRRWLKPHRLTGAFGKPSLNNGRMWLMRRAASKTFRLFVVSFTPFSRITVRGYTPSDPSPAGFLAMDEATAKAAALNIPLPSPLISTDAYMQLGDSPRSPHRCDKCMRCSCGPSSFLRASPSLHLACIKPIICFPWSFCLPFPIASLFPLSSSPMLELGKIMSSQVTRQIRIAVSHSSASQSKARCAILTVRSAVEDSLASRLIISVSADSVVASFDSFLKSLAEELRVLRCFQRLMPMCRRSTMMAIAETRNGLISFDISVVILQEAA